MNWVDRCRRNHDICARWAQRESVTAIARLYDLSEESVRAIVNAAREVGLVQREAPRYVILPDDPEREEEILRLYWDAKWNYREIGERFNITRQRVHQIVTRATRRQFRVSTVYTPATLPAHPPSGTDGMRVYVTEENKILISADGRWIEPAEESA